MAKLISPLEQHLDRQPPTVVTQATTWWETVLAHVKLQESGLGVPLPVKVCFYSAVLTIMEICEVNSICAKLCSFQQLWTVAV